MLNVSRSGYYAWRKHGQTVNPREQRQIERDEAIKQAFIDSKERNGARRILVGEDKRWLFFNGNDAEIYATQLLNDGTTKTPDKFIDYSVSTNDGYVIFFQARRSFKHLRVFPYENANRYWRDSFKSKLGTTGWKMVCFPSLAVVNLGLLGSSCLSELCTLSAHHLFQLHMPNSPCHIPWKE